MESEHYEGNMTYYYSTIFYVIYFSATDGPITETSQEANRYIDTDTTDDAIQMTIMCV